MGNNCSRSGGLAGPEETQGKVPCFSFHDFGVLLLFKEMSQKEISFEGKPIK